MRATAKEHVPNNKKNKTEVETEHYENNAVKVSNVKRITMIKWMVMIVQTNVKIKRVE